jgi:hypothetical protein
MTRPPSTPSNERTGRRNVRDIDALKKRGPERWVYVGGGSTLCPAWQNGADHAGSPYDPVGFRFGLHGDLEFKGVTDVSSFTSGDVAWTMPTEYVPENDLVVATYVLDSGTLKKARYEISSSTGDVSLVVEVSTSAGAATTAIDLRNPSTNVYFVGDPFSGFTLGLWRMLPSVASTIFGTVLLPDTFTEVAIRLVLSSSTAATGDVRMGVSTMSLSDGDSPGGTMVAETSQTISVTGNVLFARFPATGGIGSSPVAGDILVVQIGRDGTNGADTLAVDLRLWGAWLEVS